MKKYYIFLFIGVILFVGCEYNYLSINRPYNLRDRGPAGGWIFYINPNWKTDGWKYLEAAPVDQSAGAEWINSDSPKTSTSPADPQETLNGKTKTEIGTGKANTEVIISQYNHTNSAAKLCKGYSVNGYNDWFLPSQDELWQMCWNLRGVKWTTSMVKNPDVPNVDGGGIGGLDGGSVPYWSSSEYDNIYTNDQYFPHGTQDVSHKFRPWRVRAVRAF